jgi:hypothetical protein
MRRSMFRRFLFLFLPIVLYIAITPLACAQNKTILFREDFKDLDNWRALNFPKIQAHTVYSIETKDSESFLKAESKASASAIVYREEFNVYEYPKIRWSWKISNVYENSDPKAKAGDDYPLRIYIIFRYDPEASSGLEKIRYGSAKKIYREYPPHSTLNYVWASNIDQKMVQASPYTDKVKLIALEKGTKKAGIWQEEEVHIIKDYNMAFGTDPPAIAGIAIMNDADNTRQKSTSYMDFIEVFKGDE